MNDFMDILGELLGFLVWDILGVPIEMWEKSYGFMETSIALFIGVMIYGVYALTVAMIGYYLVSLVRRLHGIYVFYRDAVPCQHAECGRQATTETNSEGYPGCEAGGPCCGDCQDRHVAAAIQRRADSEPKRTCMHDTEHGMMQKQIIANFVIDKCEICGSVWLDCDELAMLEEISYDKGYSTGHSHATSASNTSLALGIAIGSSI